MLNYVYQIVFVYLTTDYGLPPFRFTLGGEVTATPTTWDVLSLMYRDILLIIICVTIRSKLGPIGLATAASANNFLGKNKNLTRTSFIVTAECPPCLRGTKWCNLQCVCICVQWGVILWDETVVFSFNFPHLTYLLRNQIIYSSE